MAAAFGTGPSSTYSFLLFAAQAGGFAANVWGRKKQERYTNWGAQMERNELSLQLQKEQLASTEEAIANTERLGEVLATQRAIFASRGVQSGQGSARALATKQIGTYNADERARQLSMSFRKHQIESTNRISKMNQSARRAERKTANFMEGINLMNFNGAFGDMLNKPGSKL
jgi:hypothetical protein